MVSGPNLLDRNPKCYWGGERERNGVLFRNCRDVTISGLHLNDVRQPDAALILEDCHRFNLTNCSILDCDNGGLLLKNVTASRVSDCLIRNDKTDTQAWVLLKAAGGRGNMIVNNLLGGPFEVDPKTAHSSGNVIGP